MDFEFATDSKGKPYVKVGLTDYALMANPMLNKGTGFPLKEREKFGLLGLIPPFESDIQTQCDRSYMVFKSKTTDLDKYIYLRDLQDSNETLFYRLLNSHVVEMLPIVYTPTVGLGCEKFSHIYRRPRGIFISYPNRKHIDQILANPRFDLVRAIVVSDGERILGLGDQGIGGMGIPIGKLALYTACAGLHPATTLPILLDAGTNNPNLEKDPLYMGWRHERVRGKKYDDFIDAFVTAIKKRFPHVLLQWEDFAQLNANPILERYREQLCTFNDDIQGTAAVAAGTLFAAINVTRTPLRDQKIVVVGAGSAGCGISNLIMKAMIENGLTEQEARRRFYLIDRPGLLVDTLKDLQSFQKPFAQPVPHWKLSNENSITLSDVVKNVHPTLLIGVSGQPGIFTEEIVREMAKHVERPVIFPLSNPTIKCEATPTNLMKWTNERAIIGTGSPFDEITKKGKKFRVDQTNNSYIFPGMGLGLIAVRAKYVTDKMFMAAANALANCSPAKKNPDANLLPPLTEIREVSFKVALAVAEEAVISGLADFSGGDLKKHLKQFVWEPEYWRYEKL